MKKTLLLIIWIFLNYSGDATTREARNEVHSTSEKKISIVCSPDVFDLANQWAIDYCKLNPGMEIKVDKSDLNILDPMLVNGKSLGLFSHQYCLSLENNSLVNIVVGREIIVPIINSANPYINLINSQGISPSDMARLLQNPQYRTWGSILENGENVAVNYYSIDNEAINSEIAGFMEIDKKYLKGIEVLNGKELVTAVQKDRFGIGFCKLTDIAGSANQEIVDNIILFPIDKNENGQIDSFEKIYDNLNNFTRGVWIGKYPKTLISDVYSVSKGIPKSESELAFLRWILSEGQQSLVQYGYCDLTYSERQSKLNMLNNQIIYVETSDNSNAYQIIGLALLFVLLVIGISGYYTIKRRKGSKGSLLKEISGYKTSFNENSVEIHNGLYFDKTHTWAFMEKDGIVKIGIDDFLQHVTGIFTRIKMKNPGERIKKNEPILTLIQEGKQLNVYAPISGTIKDINELLVTNPSKINSSPYSEGWIYMIEPSNWSREIQFLKIAEPYRDWLKNEFLLLKDFLASSVNSQSLGYANVAYQEGGEIKDHVLRDLGPEAWEDFQKKFIDTSALH
jgi:glycine cleavage system H lipoate-binding protein